MLTDRVDKFTIESFVKGDMRSFDAIYFLFNPKLQKFVYSLVKTQDDTDEIVQDVFVKLWENREKLKKYSSFESYLFTIAYNTTITLLRKKAKEAHYIDYIKSVQIEFDYSEVSEHVEWDKIDEKLHATIERMPARQKEVFKMKYIDGFSYKEIAEKLDISVNTIENHMVKAHKFLKENFGKNYLPALFLLYLIF